ncbi:putative histone acetyltransferase [Phytophthora cinnamomi]|uniref:putative histone acetyltransferase n=1 Tax=Phytophthora cinnamomi TaxID=4785 RepID=UPI00355A70D6|nr:putative histone acetyltransferase [Phytophthora cinnamomi]
MEVQEAASRLLACPRLSREREAERQRAIQRPLAVSWREKVEANGQVYISISSDEEEDEEEEQLQPQPQPQPQPRAQRLLDVKTEFMAPQPEIVTIDSDSDEQQEEEAEEREEVPFEAEEAEEPVRVKRKLEVLEIEDEGEEEKEEEEEEEAERPVAVEEETPKKKKKPQRQVATRQNVVWEQHHVAGVRKRRMDEEDAAFLLFYGERETPSANILRLIVELISTGVGASDAFLSELVKYMLWRKLSSAVEAGLASERVVQSEWTKIVFSCPVPAHRRRSGPMPRPDLLPRPVTITVRPLQFARKQPQRRNLCVPTGVVDFVTKQEPLSPRATPEETAVALANRLAGKGVRSKSSAKSPKKSTKTAQTKSPRGEVRKRPLPATYTAGMPTSNGYANGAEFSPRKQRRRNGEVGLPPVTPRQVVRAKSSNGQSISQKLMEPLPYDCRTLGDNRSLPIGWKPPGQQAQIVDPVEVNPTLQMTADEIAQHIASKTPSAEHLRRWYNKLLTKAKEYGIVKDWTTMYDRYFSDSVCGTIAKDDSKPSASFVSVKEENGVGVSTRGTTVQSVNPDELVWPANQLPPIFDGDIIPSELERILGRIMSRNEKQKRASENKKLAARGKNSSVARAGGKLSLGGVFTRIKEEVPTVPPSAPLCTQNVDVKVREVFSKCQFAVQRLKQDLLVVDLVAIDDDEAIQDDGCVGDRPQKICRPEALVPSWCSQVPRFFGSRFMFHQLCSYAGYQFDSLRRAKHSTMMMLHHYFNEQVAQLNVFCRECNLLVTRANFWSCRSCTRYALCDTCYRRQGKEHEHALIFGPAPLPTLAAGPGDLRASSSPSPAPSAAATTGYAAATRSSPGRARASPAWSGGTASHPRIRPVSIHVLNAVAKDSFRRDFFLRCFTEREAQALELRFAFLHRVRQYKRLVGRRDLLPRAAKDIVASYLQQVESTNQLLLPPAAEPLRARVLAAAAAGHCPLDLFNGVETLVREHMTRDAFPQFLRSSEYTELCEALRARRELPLAEVLVDARRTQFLMRFLAERFPGEEGNLRFWVHVQTRFLPLIQTTLFSVALFEEVQRHVRHVFNRFLVGENETSSAATRVPETVRRATLQQIMKLQSEPFSPPRYANLFRAAQDCVWEWLQTGVYPKFRTSSLYVVLVVDTEDLETDQQLRRLSEHPYLRTADLPLSTVFKEISSQTLISIIATILVGKSILLVSERSAALVAVAEATRELLKPFEWIHFYIPFCPVRTCSELSAAGLFSDVNTSPFFIGCEGAIVYQKKDSGTDQRFRIRNSIYTTHKVSLHVQPPATATPSEYPAEILQTAAIIIDIDSDDIFVPEKVDIPELPQSLLRSLENILSDALHSSRITQADSHLFGPSKTPSFVSEMLQQADEDVQHVTSDEPSVEIEPNQPEQPTPSLDDKARLALVWFLEALFGDVVYYFCSFHQNFAVESPTAVDADEFLLFEVDSFLDAHTELGCRDFFRQCFHTELFRKFILAQHMQFAFSAASEAIESSESLQVDPEVQRDSAPDAFI